MSEMTGKEHFESAQRMLDAPWDKDAQWAIVQMLRALVHAQLATASRDLGLAFPPRELEAPTAQTVAANAEFPRETGEKISDLAFRSYGSRALNWHLDNSEVPDGV